MANNLYCNDSKDRPYHCDKCGDTFEPCSHWSEEMNKRQTEDAYYTGGY